MNKYHFDNKYFYVLADEILNQHYLLINSQKYRIIEIEFYLYSKNHPDSYTHCHQDQLLTHTFYFHKFSNGSYKGGTYKGLDLTLGDNNEVYFGILIRSIRDMKLKTVIEGPCNVVNKILSLYNCKSIYELTHGKSLNIFENDLDFVLKNKNLEKPIFELSERPIFCGQRIGLSNKYLEYRNKRYRYAIYRYQIKKRKSMLESCN